MVMPHLEGIIELKDFGLVVSRSEKLTYAREHLNEMFGRKYPCRFRPENVSYRKETSPEELSIINYTSGTTGYSKGVMLPYRSILSNVLYCKEKIGIKAGDSVVSMLPLGHVFGMVLISFMVSPLVHICGFLPVCRHLKSLQNLLPKFAQGSFHVYL